MDTIRRKPLAAATLSPVSPATPIKRKPLVPSAGSYDLAQHYEDDDEDDEFEDPSIARGVAAPEYGGARGYDLAPGVDQYSRDVTEEIAMVPSLNESDDYIYDAPPVTRTVVNSKHRQHDSHGDNLIEYSNYPDHWEQDGGHGRQLWTPIWLRRTALVVFAVAFALMSLATGLLYHFSQVNNGISSQHEFNHYGWKYGPTALLVIFRALWGQVDFYNRLLTPWQELRTTGVSVQKSLLLDYISPLMPWSLWKAVKNRHWAVIMSITGHLLILGTTVFSTGLFDLEPTQLTWESDQFQVRSKFEIAESVDAATAWAVGPSAAQIFYGTHFKGLDFPAGTSDDVLVAELAAPPGDFTGLEYLVTTDGLTVNFDCDILPITNGTQADIPWESILAPFWVANITIPGCHIQGVTLAEGPDHDYFHDPHATQDYQAQFVVYPCNLDLDFSRDPLETAKQQNMVANTSADQRVFMSVADLRYSPEILKDDKPPTSEYMYLHGVTAVLCTPSYTLSQYDVQRASAINGSAIAEKAAVGRRRDQGSQIEGLPPAALAMATEYGTSQWYLGTGGRDYKLSEEVPTFFQLMEMLSGDDTIGAYMDADHMIDVGSRVFKGIGTQVLSEIGTRPHNGTITGRITYTENRLVVKGLSTGFMCSFLALLAFLSIGMVFVRPHSATPSHPGSVASAAALLASSPRFCETLIHSEAAHLAHIHTRLDKFRFQSVIGTGPEPTFSIEPIQLQEGQSFYRPPDDGMENISWWRPMSSTTWFLSLAIALPLILIALLQVIQHLSDTNNGFVNITDSGATPLITYIPAAVALGVAGLYGALAFMAAVFSPFATLKRGRATPQRSIYMNLVGKLLPNAAALSIKARYFAVLAALLGSFLGEFLPILVSGLYTTEDTVQKHDVTVHQQDAFNFENSALSVEDNQASAIDSLVEYLTLGSPLWTYNSLVFNHFGQSNVSIQNSSATSTTLRATVPAVRAKLNCSVVSEESRRMTYINTDQEENEESSLPGSGKIYEPRPGYVLVGFNTTFDGPSICERFPRSNKSDVTWMQYYWLPYDNSPGYIGEATTMIYEPGFLIGDGAADTDPDSGEFGANGFSTGGYGCPTFAVTLGEARAVSTRVSSNVTSWNVEYELSTIMCYQNVEQVETKTTWELPQYNFDKSNPPEPDNSTTKLLKTAAGSERFEFTVNAWLEGLSNSVYNLTIPGPDNSNRDVNNLDEFITAAITSKDGRPLEDLLGIENIQNLTEVSNILYGTYMAQAINANMRSTNSSSSSKRSRFSKRSGLPSYPGTVTMPGPQRLHQIHDNAIALQVMLGAMVACAVVTRLLLQVREVLPHNPCSIAGTATMLVGGDMVTRRAMPAGSEWKSDRELRRDGVLADGLYSLRRWEQGEKHMLGRTWYGIDREHTEHTEHTQQG